MAQQRRRDLAPPLHLQARVLVQQLLDAVENSALAQGFANRTLFCIEVGDRLLVLSRRKTGRA